VSARTRSASASRPWTAIRFNSLIGVIESLPCRYTFRGTE
jgi:hypothetical protein